MLLANKEVYLPFKKIAIHHQCIRPCRTHLPGREVAGAHGDVRGAQADDGVRGEAERQHRHQGHGAAVVHDERAEEAAHDDDDHVLPANKSVSAVMLKGGRYVSLFPGLMLICPYLTFSPPTKTYLPADKSLLVSLM